MILQRIRENLFNQNWSAMAAEILIIVVGIFLGLQADAWLQERALKADIQLQLDRIQEDVTAIHESTLSVIESMDDQLRAFGLVNSVLEGEPLTESNRNEFNSGLYISYQQVTVDLQIPGLENLIDTGNINLISNDLLREELLNYSNERRIGNEIKSHQLRLWDMQIEVLFKYISFGMSSENGTGRSILVYDLDELRGSREFIIAFRNSARMARFVRNSLEQDSNDLQRLMDAF